jgi:hypothetical protein
LEWWPVWGEALGKFKDNFTVKKFIFKKMWVYCLSGE